MIGWNHLQQFKAHARNLDCENVSQVHTLFFYQRENCLKAFFVRTVQFFVVNKKGALTSDYRVKDNML